jgi:O-antigen ligase
MWVGILLGFAVLCVIGGPLLRQRLAIGVLVVATLVTGFLLFGGSAGKEAVRPVVERGETLVNPTKAEHESSLEQRGAETKVAWKKARSNLLFGIGPGVPFGFSIPEAVRTSEGTVVGFSQPQQLFLHNQYLYLLMITGIPGLLAFLVFLGTPVVTAFRFARDDFTTIACALGIAMIMLSAFVAIYFTVVDMTAVLGLLAGVTTAAVEARRRGEGT